MRHGAGLTAIVIGLILSCGSLIPPDELGAEETESEHVLFRAIRSGNLPLLNDILGRGTPPDVRRSDGTTPLMFAALQGSAEMVQVLLDRGADANAANNRGVTALLWAAPDVEKVRLLLARGAEPNAVSRLGNTPLAVASGSPTGAPSVALLLQHGADITATNKRGRNVLRFAAYSGSVESVRHLIDHAKARGGVDRLLDQSGYAISTAAANGFDKIVDLLLEHGANPNYLDRSRADALHNALLAGHTKIATTLINHGADLDRHSQPGNTPTAVLAAYAESDDPSIVQLLSKQGVDFSELHDGSETALTWARMRGHQNLIETLVAIGTPEGRQPDRPQVPSHEIVVDDTNQARLITQAVQKSIDLLQTSSDTFLDIRRNCVSCHHQNLPGVAIAWASRDRGFHVRESSINRMLDRQTVNWQSGVERAYQLDSPYPVPPRFLGWGMWSFAELGYRPNELTQAISWYLASIQQPDGRWVSGTLRPPMGGNDILATILALRSLQLYPLVGRPQENSLRIESATKYLRGVETETFLDELARLIGLGWAGIDPAELSDETSRILAAQHDDGGWSQLPGLLSDAWATGQVLVALHTAGGIPVNDPRFQAGIEFLLRTQFDDGSWYVQARARPFQPYFESKFPYGRDQWVSAPSTAWATMVLMLAVDPRDVSKWNQPRESEALKETASKEEPSEDRKELPPVATKAIDFASDIKPILDRSCLGCHNEDEPESNFVLTSRAALIRGGDSEIPAIIPGVSAESPLVRFAAGVDPEIEMPPSDARDEFPPLTPLEISLLRAWVDQGANW